jgi:selenocysteine lyase/cysteine desulfurase
VQQIKRGYIAGIVGNTRINEINFDNAATTPPLKEVVKAVNDFLPYYSSVHRGSGKKSAISSELFEDSRTAVMAYFNANNVYDTIIYVKNTTEAINKLSNRLAQTCGKRNIVISTFMEHHSNDLPWRRNFNTMHACVDGVGRLDLNDLEAKLKANIGKVRLVAITAASNVTGYVNNLHCAAALAHKYGAEIFADCAQYAGHLPLDMKEPETEEHIDYIAFSAHKMYAPFGTGCLVGSKAAFKDSPPDYSGGGTVKLVMEDFIVWDAPPHRDEAGTPNLIGVLALRTAIKVLKEIGLENILNREAELAEYAFYKLSAIDGVKIYSDMKPPRIGVISFNLKDIYHEDLSKLLSESGKIAVRSGCFCAQPYVQRLLGLSKEDIEVYKTDFNAKRPGLVRISFGFYNTKKEIDILARFLKSI